MKIELTTEKIGKWEFYETFNLHCWWRNLLNKNIWTQWLYIIFPFIVTAFVLILFQLDGALILESNKFSFLNDTSNSICMIFLYILSYFLSPLYPLWIRRGMDSIKKYCLEEPTEMLNKVTTFAHVMICISIVGSLAGIPFALNAYNQQIGWMERISNITNVFYGIYLSLTWYSSLCLLVYAMTGSYIFKKILENPSWTLFEGNYEIEKVKKHLNCAAQCLSATISYASFWIIAAIIIIFNDNVNVKFGVHMTFEKYPIAAILVILFVIIGLAFVLVPSIEFSKVVKKAKMDAINKIIQSEVNDDEKIKKKQEIELIENSVFASGISKIILFISIAVPVISLVIQIVTEFGR